MTSIDADIDTIRQCILLDGEEIRQSLALAALALAEAKLRTSIPLDCGQDGPVCGAPCPGCARHYSDMVREVSAERDQARARAADLERKHHLAVARVLRVTDALDKLVHWYDHGTGHIDEAEWSHARAVLGLEDPR
jgi:hypothetical protein